MVSTENKLSLERIGKRIEMGRKWPLIDEVGQLICFYQKNLSEMFPNNRSIPAGLLILTGIVWCLALGLSILYLSYPSIIICVGLFIATLYRTDKQRSWLYQSMEHSKDEIGLLLSHWEKVCDSKADCNKPEQEMEAVLSFIKGRSDINNDHLSALGLLFKEVHRDLDKKSPS